MMVFMLVKIMMTSRVQVLHTQDIPDSRYTHMVMQFGQFLDHDITLTPEAGGHLSSIRSDQKSQLYFYWFQSTLPTELDCCDETFLNEDRLQPENMQRCLNLEIDGQCIAFTRWPIHHDPLRM